MDSEYSHTQKSALVVDDSKLARYVLKEMLVAHGIKVDTAESAEEALGMLSAHKPDVIFMDHMMPGMDGFQAVQAIKNDPSTAKIPILMYTSKDEGVYVNQARALGAVGVLPKKLKPVQLERVLQQLKLIPFNKEPKKAPETSAEHESDRVKQAQAEIISETRHTLEELARSASEDLEKDSMRHLFRQLFLEQRDCIKLDQHELLGEMVTEVRPAITQVGQQTRRGQIGVLGLIAVTLLCVIGFGVSRDSATSRQLHELTAMQNATYENTQQLMGTLNDQSFAQGRYTNANNGANTASNSGVSTELLAWALNQNNQLSYQEPLTSARMQNHMNGLLIALEQSNFNGTLTLRYHAGQYCEKKDGDAFILVSDDAPMSQCTIRSEAQWAEQSQVKNWAALIEQWNSAYTGFYIQFEDMGAGYTKQDYPVVIGSGTSATPAKQWNAAAMVNHRLVFSFD